MRVNDLVTYLASELDVQRFNDYCHNGLQVQGSHDVNSVVTAVTASLEAINFAIQSKAQTLIVHHGLFWGQGSETIDGWLKDRVAALLSADINLLAYHLPLDCHPVLGNNSQMAHDLMITPDSVSSLGWQQIEWLGAMGKLANCMSLSDYIDQLKTCWVLHERDIVTIENKSVETVAWCTGAAHDAIEHAAAKGCDLFISGEASERTFHLAKELGVHFIRLGHHATERYGVRALGEWLQSEQGMNAVFYDEDNPF